MILHTCFTNTQYIKGGSYGSKRVIKLIQIEGNVKKWKTDDNQQIPQHLTVTKTFVRKEKNHSVTGNIKIETENFSPGVMENSKNRTAYNRAAKEDSRNPAAVNSLPKMINFNRKGTLTLKEKIISRGRKRITFGLFRICR